MCETNSTVRVSSVMATASAVAITLAVMGSPLSVPLMEYDMPKIEAVLSRDLIHTLETLNTVCIVQTPQEKLSAISKFVGTLVSESRDLEPDVKALVQSNFWDLV